MSTVVAKYKSFIPSKLRPEVVGARVSVTHIQSWPEFCSIFSNMDISSIKNFSTRQKLILQICNFSKAFFDNETKELIKVLQNVYI